MEVLQKKFEEFQTDLAAHEERVNEVNQFAGKLIQVSTVMAGTVQVVWLLVALRRVLRLNFPSFALMCWMQVLHFKSIYN